MTKTMKSITIDTEVDIALKRTPNFNVSQFCNEALRTALNVKDIKFSEEEHKLATDIAEERIKLQMMESKLDDIVGERKKEEERWKDFTPRKALDV